MFSVRVLQPLTHQRTTECRSCEPERYKGNNKDFTKRVERPADRFSDRSSILLGSTIFSTLIYMGVEFFMYGGTKRIKIIPHFAVWDRFLYDFL